jgi:hypothetical protein
VLSSGDGHGAKRYQVEVEGLDSLNHYRMNYRQRDSTPGDVWRSKFKNRFLHEEATCRKTTTRKRNSWETSTQLWLRRGR